MHVCSSLRGISDPVFDASYRRALKFGRRHRCSSACPLLLLRGGGFCPAALPGARASHTEVPRGYRKHVCQTMIRHVSV